MRANETKAFWDMKLTIKKWIASILAITAMGGSVVDGGFFVKNSGFLASLWLLNTNILLEQFKPSVAKEDVIQTYKPDYEIKLEAWIDKLETFELDFGYPREHCIIDVNGKESCSCLQYQEATFTGDATKYFEASPEWIKNNKTNCKVQKELAKEVLLNEKNGWTRWKTSVVKRGLGVPPIPAEYWETKVL